MEKCNISEKLVTLANQNVKIVSKNREYTGSITEVGTDYIVINNSIILINNILEICVLPEDEYVYL